MERDLEDAVYSSDEHRVLDIVKREGVAHLALRYAVRYDRGLIINLLLPIIISEKGGTKTSVIEDVTREIVSDAISSDSTPVLNSLIYNDILNIYTILRVSVFMGNMKYYKWSLDKIRESGLTIEPGIWEELAMICISGVETSKIFRDIINNHADDIDISSMALSVIGVKSISKLDSLLEYRKRLDITSLVISSIESHFDEGTRLLLRYIYTSNNIDNILEVGVSNSNLDVIEELLPYYRGKKINLVLLAIDSGDTSIYHYLMSGMRRISYNIIAKALARKGMVEELIDVVSNISDYTAVIEELIKSGYSDMIEDLLDMEPESIEYLPILFTAYKEGDYTSVRDTLFSYREYVTDIDRVFDDILTKGRDSISILRKTKIDLSPILPYVQDLNMHDIARFISTRLRYG